MDTRKFFIRPQIPAKIAVLEELSQNMWTYWDKDAERLFHRLDPKLFRRLHHNAVELLYKINEERLIEVSKDKGFLYELKQINDRFKNYMEFEGTYTDEGRDVQFNKDDLIAYTCMEYGLHESLPFYSGGLAVLAGDLLKSASDVGISMVSFGLLYARGYFNQRIASDGMQVEEFKTANWALTPIKEVLKQDDSPLFIEIPLKNEMVKAKLWKIHVGKTMLYLIDTNIHQNPEKFRNICNMLYDANRVTRIEQELILGRGSVIAAKALGLQPKVYHINEGHTAFLILERLIEMINVGGLSFEEAKENIRSSTVFTTHTPIVEGNEHFSDELVKEYLENEVKSIGLTMNDFLSLGKVQKDKMFWLPVFSLRFSRCSNGVSKLHSVVSRSMWRGIYPTMHEREIPIDSVTNGVHLQSWLSLQITELFDRYIGPDYFYKATQSDVWDNIYSIPDGEIWNAHMRRKEQVISFIRRKISKMMTRRGYGAEKIDDVESVLSPHYLTIGFARRFAPYKRANLILTDPKRLTAILTNKEKPVQLVFSGKAHPADEEGKKIIKEIYDFIANYPVENHVVFIEDYDINIARHLVQGVDVWLNTPIKPMEASGTSGIKAGINGVLNLSVLDGWWPEAYNKENGWAISAGEGIDDPKLARKAEANQLYELLENEVTDLYYNRKEGGMPLEWVGMMKNLMVTTCSEFNMQRTVRDYLHKFYLPQMNLSKQLSEHDGELMKSVMKQKKTIDAAWPRIYLKDYFTSIDGKMPVSGERVDVECYVYLDDVDEKQVLPEIFYCFGDEQYDVKTIPLDFVEKYPDKVAKYKGSVVLEGNGMQEIAVRVVPADPGFRQIYSEYIKWKE